MRTWSGWFRRRTTGARSISWWRPTLREAREVLARRYPDDVGADGELENGDGEWYWPWPHGEAA